MSIYSQISANKTKTYLIMALFVVFFTTVIYVLMRAAGFVGPVWIVGVFFVLLTSLFSYYFSDRMVLAISGAKELKDEPGRDVFDIVNNLSIGAGIPRPKLYLIDNPAPNAFATGRDPQHASIAVTTGLLQLLSRTELEGVIAHELSHIKNFDTRLMVIVSVLVGTIAMLADVFLRSRLWGNSGDNRKAGAIWLVLGLVFAILSPIVATLIQLAISRRREFLADASGAYLTRFPEGLAKALEKLESHQKQADFANSATAHLYIVNPFGPKNRQWLSSLFQTHPPLNERIKALRSM